MATLDLYNTNNEKVGALEVSDLIFGAPIKRFLLTEIIHWQRASKREGTACTKTKAEVHGTTKKPFPQKGRGMARQGSLKNPHQVGGGVAFGPKPRDHGYAMPKAKRRAALASALSLRNQEGALKILKDFDLAEVKTKVALGVLKALNTESALVVDADNQGLKIGMRNLASAKYLEEAGLNVYDILRYPALILTEKAVRQLESRMAYA